MAKREYPRNDNEYPEVMSKMDPLIIRVDPLVMVVGSTTYTAKVKIGYKFNGFLVHVSGVGIPIYKEEVDITGYNTGKTTTGEGSDAYKYVQDKARDWMDTLEKSMLDDNREKNIVDLLRELKYQMHFDASGHKYPAIIEPGQPGYDPEKYDSRMEVCTDVPTYITDIYQLLADMNAKLNNLMLVIASDGTGDSTSHKNELITSVTVKYGEEENPHGFIVENSYSGEPVIGLNKRIEDLNASIGTSVDDPNNPNNGKSLQTRITDIQNSIGNSSDTKDTTTVIGKLIDIKTKLAADEKTLGGQIAEAVGVLVARMDDMNGRIGTPSDLVGAATLFGQIGTTNNRIGDPANIASDTLFDYLDNIESDTNTIVNYPLLTTFTATDALWLTYWVHDVYGGGTGTADPSGIDQSGYAYMIDTMKMFFEKQNTCTSKKLNAAMIEGVRGHGYETAIATERGFTNASNNGWGIYVHI